MPKIVNKTLTGGWDLISLPSRITYLYLKERTLSKLLEIKFSSDESLTIPIGTDFTTPERLWNLPIVYVKGEAGSVVEGFYYV